MKEKIFSIGEWKVFPPNKEISRNGYVFILEPRLIDLLTYFAKFPDQVLSRDELINNIWKRGMVTDHVVTQCISELRKSLKKGEGDNDDYIITVPKRGYRLVKAVKWLGDVDDELLLTASDDENLSILYQQEGEGCAIKYQENVNITSISEIPSDESIEIETPSSLLPSQSSVEETEPDVKLFSSGRSHFWEWLAFLFALALCVSFVAVAAFNVHRPAQRNSMILNPRDIDIHLKGGGSCSNWSNQVSYALGLTDTTTRALNTFTTYRVHDQTNYSASEGSSSGKSLYIEFINEHHYRAQQCFLSIRLVDHADNSVMLDKRYFITANNPIAVQSDFLISLFKVLNVTIPLKAIPELNDNSAHHNTLQQRFYMVLQWVQRGDLESLLKAAGQLDELIIENPDANREKAYKVLTELLLNSYRPYDDAKIQQLYNELQKLADIPELQGGALLQQIFAVHYLSEGRADEAYNAVNKSIALEMSWLNYVLLGKSYELNGENNFAADAYITAFNLRPGPDTLNWIKNGVFHTDVSRVTPYLNSYLSDN